MKLEDRISHLHCCHLPEFTEPATVDVANYQPLVLLTCHNITVLSLVQVPAVTVSGYWRRVRWIRHIVQFQTNAFEKDRPQLVVAPTQPSGYFRSS